jgi:hypothetical protein
MREETKKSTLNLFYSAFFFILYPNDHEDAFITPENERYCAGGSGTRSIKFLEI